MTCSRCGSLWPNPSCYVCAEDDTEVDAFQASREAAVEAMIEHAEFLADMKREEQPTPTP